MYEHISKWLDIILCSKHHIILLYMYIVYMYYIIIIIPTVEEKPPVAPVKTEVKEEAVTVTKDETTSAQPTGMSSHFITSIVC